LRRCMAGFFDAAPMKILVTLALETEFAPWRTIREFRAGNYGTADAYLADIHGAELAVILTGAGPRQAAKRASKAIRAESDSLSACISSGLAGALRPEYGIGQVLVAHRVFSEEPREDWGLQELPSSEPLISFAADQGAKVVERFHTSARVVARAEEKHHLGASADAVEMESFEVLRAAAASGVPAVAIRAVSDVADEDLPLGMNRIFTDEGQVSISRVVGQVARHPQSIPSLVKFAQQTKVAAESLARFLDRYVGTIVKRTQSLESKATAGRR
jgi:adenosylhomocysteine nucleosidase